MAYRATITLQLLTNLAPQCLLTPVAYHYSLKRPSPRLLQPMPLLYFSEKAAFP